MFLWVNRSTTLKGFPARVFLLSESQDVWVMIFAGIAGFVLRQANYPVAPLVIGLILGPMTENNLRKTLMMFRGNVSLILDRPIAMVFLTLALAFILFKILYPFLRRKFVNPRSAN